MQGQTGTDKGTAAQEGERGEAAISIVLHPIHDTEDQHVADRLGYGPLATSPDDPVAALARALATAIYELDDQQRLGQRELVIDLPVEWLDRPDLLPAPARQVILGLPAELALDAPQRAQLEGFRERGYRLMFDAATLARQGSETPRRGDFVRLQHPDALDTAGLEALHQRGVELLADPISDPDRLARFRALGCTRFDGRYLAEPRFYRARPGGRHGHRAAHLRLVNELYRHDVDLPRLHALLLQMPHLHVAILRRASTGFYARGGPPADLRRAIQLLGIDELRRLIMILSLAGELPSSTLKLRLALVRAFLCRNLAAPFRNIDPEAAFTTGLFSLMGPLLDEPQEALLDELPLDAAMHEALSRRGGHLGALLTLAEEHERQLATPTETLSLDRLQQCYLEAIAQTERLMGSHS